MASPNTVVTIVAIGTTGRTGVLAPSVAGWWNSRNQKDDQAHRDNAAKAEDRRRVLRESVEIISRFSILVGDAKVVEGPGEGARVQWTGSHHPTDVLQAIHAHRYVVDLWFGYQSDVAGAYRKLNMAVMAAMKDRLKLKPGEKIDLAKALPISAAWRTFLDAARPWLDVREVVKTS